jgi:hypothetical protein
MRIPGYTAALSLRPSIGHYATAHASAQSQGMVAPQLMAVVTYIPDWALASTWDPYGSSIGSATAAARTACMLECLHTAEACERNCRSLPREDRAECKAGCYQFFRNCKAGC